MNGFLTLEEAIRKNDAEQVAYLLRVSPTIVRAWRREPETEEGSATGRRSPLDRVCDLVDAVFLVNPQGADLIVEHVRAHLESLKLAQHRTDVDVATLKEQLREAQATLTKLSDQLNAAGGSKLRAVE